MQQDLIVFQPLPLWPAVVYYIISVIVFILLYMGKIKVNNLHKYPLLVFYTLFVIAIAAVQINIFANGQSFVKGFLRINFNPHEYDSIYWGALFFSMLYLLAMPKNKF